MRIKHQAEEQTLFAWYMNTMDNNCSSQFLPSIEKDHSLLPEAGTLRWIYHVKNIIAVFHRARWEKSIAVQCTVWNDRLLY